MARIMAYCDSPEAGTGFGRSAHHVLHALHGAGHEIVQLAINHDPSMLKKIPWRIFSPSRLDSDPYGLWDLPMILHNEGPFDLLWSTFDPEVPWSYVLPGVQPRMSVIDIFLAQRRLQPGFKLAGWFPVDGGPLSEFEMGVLIGDGAFDLRATMSPHVYEAIQWTCRLRGNVIDPAKMAQRLHVVPHGINLSLYRIASEDGRRAAKQLLGFPADTFLLVQVERNQQRKQVWQAMEILEKLRRALPGKKIHLYQHMHMDEENQHSKVGWKLDDLAWRFGLRAHEDVRWRHQKFSEEEMVDVVYAAADAVISTSSGEGFQYPLWEALACGRRVVAPNDSARKAWLGCAPGTHLYRTDEHGMVHRRAYNRRMSFADTGDACRVLRKMIEGQQKYSEAPEASRAWVARRADVQMVKDWWLDAISKELQVLEKERAAMSFTVHGDPEIDHVISLRGGPGLGDLAMMLPAFAAFARLHPGDVTCLAVPPDSAFLDLATMYNPFDLIQLDNRVPLEALGRNLLDVSGLWKPVARMGWASTDVHRTHSVADFLGVPREELRKLPAMPMENHIKKATAHFVQRYGVHPRKCIAICPNSHQPNRRLPEAYVLTVAEQVINMGLVPVLVDGQKSPCARVGILNLTGSTDAGGMIGLLGAVRAAICIDSGPLHIAALQGTPTVALMPLYDASTRLGYYTAQIEVVRPGHDEIDGVRYPAGKDGSPAWAASIFPAQILDALQRLLGLEKDDGQPRIILPEGS
jgi:hypothetical protein